MLAEYVDNGRKELGGEVNFGMPNDKGHCNTLGLQTTYITTPAGLCVMACPVVPSTK